MTIFLLIVGVIHKIQGLENDIHHWPKVLSHINMVSEFPVTNLNHYLVENHNIPNHVAIIVIN